MLEKSFLFSYNHIMDATNELKNYRFTYRDIERPQKNEFSRHMHHYYEILFFLEGDLSYVVEDKVYQLQPYDLLLIPSTKYHFANILSSARYRRYVIDFTSAYTEDRLLKEVYSKGKYFHLDENSEILRVFETLRDFSENPLEPYNELACKTLLTEILLHLARLQNRENVPSDTVSNSVCSPIVEYISNNLTTIRSIDEIANALFISKSYLTHQFKYHMGISLMKYIRNKRLLLAQTLLHSGKKPTEIYESCGFQDYATFFRAYVNCFGNPPSKENQPL